jgi:hypothetical protein
MALVLDPRGRQAAELHDAARQPIARSLELLQALQARTACAQRRGNRR